MIETVNRSRSRQGCIKRACTTGKKLGLRLLFSLCVFSIGSELCSRCFWKLQGLSFFQCQKEIHLAFYPELKYVDALSIRRDDEYYDILLLGGSALHEAFGSIERLLGIRLELEKNKKVRLHNMAFRAHSTLDSYYKYRHLSDKRFDLVIVYHGINEVRANNCPPSLFREDYSHYSWYRAINSYEKASDSKLLIFPYTLTLTWIRGLDWLGLRRYVSTAKPNPSWIDYAGTIRTKEPFERNLARILELAEAKCEPVVLMSFSYYIPEEYPDVADWWMPIELWGKPEYVAKGIAVHNTVIEELARSHTHVMFIDQNKLVPKEKKFFRDICHFTGQGSERFVNNYLLARYMYAIEKRHNDAFAHYELANTLFRLERYTKAISHYHRSLQIEPNHAGAYVNLGRAVAAQGNLEQAISFFRQALHIQPYIGRGRGQIGTLLQLLGEFDRIHNPNCRKPRVVLNFVTVHRDLGIMLQLLDENDKTISILRQKLQTTPDDPDTHHNLVVAMRLGDKLRGAIFNLQQSLKDDSGEAEASYNLGKAIALQGRFDKAISQFRHALQLKPDDVETTYVLETALKLQDKVSKVTSHCRQMLRAKSGGADVQYNAAKVFRPQDALDEAINHFQQALLLQPNDPETYYHLGEALESQGKIEKAITQYRQALRLNHNYAEAYCKLGNLMLGKEKLNVAISHYSQALKVMTHNADLHYHMGEAFRSQGKHEESMSHYRQALQVRPDHGEALYNLEVVRKLKRELQETR